MTLNISLDESSIDDAIKKLNEYKKWLEGKSKELCERLAMFGSFKVSSGFFSAIYDGDKDYEVTVEETKDWYNIIASGETVLILEFGAGITYGYGHPLAEEMGMGPGTHPDPHYKMVHGELVPNWRNPKGWYTPDRTHTYGNSPAMPMYNTVQDIRKEVERIAKEVFQK